MHLMAGSCLSQRKHPRLNINLYGFLIHSSQHERSQCNWLVSNHRQSYMLAVAVAE